MESIKSEIENLRNKFDSIIFQQQENNILLRRHLELFEVTQALFPLNSEEKLRKLEQDLSTEKKNDMLGAISRILCGNLNNIERIFAKELLISHNFDGTKEKKSFKVYVNVLNTLYEAVKKEGYAYEDFKKELRLIFRRIKNTHNKDKARKEQKENSLN